MHRVFPGHQRVDHLEVRQAKTLLFQFISPVTQTSQRTNQRAAMRCREFDICNQ